MQLIKRVEEHRVESEEEAGNYGKQPEGEERSVDF